MPRFIAFLRAINVGGHTVKMDDLRQLFEALGFSGVETFIASGNVVFETTARNTKVLEGKIERRLREALGYEVATFIRTDAELADIANYTPFRQSDLDAAAGDLRRDDVGDRIDLAGHQRAVHPAVSRQRE